MERTNSTFGSTEQGKPFGLGIVAAIGVLEGIGGHVKCHECGRTKHLSNTAKGWPKCCGNTMQWLAQKALDEKKAD